MQTHLHSNKSTPILLLSRNSLIEANVKFMGRDFISQELSSLTRYKQKLTLSRFGIGVVPLETGESKLRSETKATNVPVQCLNHMGENEFPGY